jgi:hypothetical protein
MGLVQYTSITQIPEQFLPDQHIKVIKYMVFSNQASYLNLNINQTLNGLFNKYFALSKCLEIVTYETF